MAELLLVSLGSTAGLRAADAELAAAIERAGVGVAVASARPPRPVRTLALTDLAWALAARAAAIAALRRAAPTAVIYSTITAALLAPVRGAIRFDAPAAANRPGRHGIWQRPLERRRLEAARLLVPYAAASLAAVGEMDVPTVILPVPVAPSGPLLAVSERDIAAITYAANPHKKGLDRVLEAWSLARRDGEELLVVGGAEGATREGVRTSPLLAREQYRALLRRARIYITAPRREDFGQAQLEALADGCALVTTPSPGVYPALELARELDARLVSDELAPAIRSALDQPRADYATAARRALEPYSIASVDRVVANELLPALIASA